MYLSWGFWSSTWRNVCPNFIYILQNGFSVTDFGRNVIAVWIISTYNVFFQSRKKGGDLATET